ncbi:TonB-dependent receptor [Sphingomonas oligophenolica]|uniref:TonB-dependent receptor n=1 Tax=Sphingomonas oligophenolica TaxID=301154 RepID=A0ABU9YBU5_9SPHN
MLQRSGLRDTELQHGIHVTPNTKGPRDTMLLQAGVRYDHTDQSTTSRIRVPGATIAYTDLTTSSRYGCLLPSAIAIYHLTETLDLRAAYSRTLGRPLYDAYAARSALNFVKVSDIGNPNAIGVTATIGNPNIKPRVSGNFELSAEWRIRGKSSGFSRSLCSTRRSRTRSSPWERWDIPIRRVAFSTRTPSSLRP